jgi:hypothetical protein
MWKSGAVFLHHRQNSVKMADEYYDSDALFNSTELIDPGNDAAYLRILRLGKTDRTTGSSTYENLSVLFIRAGF